MGTTSSVWHSSGLPLLLERRDLPDHLIRAAVQDLTAGTFDDTEAAALLIALRLKGEAASEIATAVEVLRGAMIRLRTETRPVLDTCGTGGDGTGTFNISTATALVVAGTGTPVVKHGNRSVSSRSGSADVLAALGVPVESGPAWSQGCLECSGFAFCFAPHFHPALAKVSVLRRKLGVRTIFNLVGPLLNPAGAEHQLLGVGRRELLDPMAGALARLGTGQALLVHGQDGLDEVSLSAPTLVRRVRDGSVERLEWTPADFGLAPVEPGALAADGPPASAEIVRLVLAGSDGPARRVVLANAAAALLAADRVPALPEGVALAARSIDSGAARRVLERLARPPA
ncbi:MAG TPA: anthranilate phosphoribosyltransferase [Gemmataceae bacterium]|nr:anthranilate phosphoribosyltransferase [Gemmataceae bacterium]